MKNCKHKLLVAKRGMLDENFAQTVIFVLEHDARGAFGVVVNRRMQKCDCGECPMPPPHYFSGGPCPMPPGAAIMMHGLERFADRSGDLIPGLWLGCGHICEEAEALPRDDHRFKVFVGHAGWGSGQLEFEIGSGAWDVRDATAELILDGDPDELWEQLAPPAFPQFSVN